jgi:inhibitor of cysteine peptidase
MLPILLSILLIVTLVLNNVIYIFAEHLGFAGSVNSIHLIGRRFVSELTLAQADNGKSFAVRPGDAIAIRLPENPTTGYQWAIDQTNSEIIELLESVFSPGSETAIGSGGVRIVRFRAKTPGTVQIRLKKWRSWQGDSSIVERFEVTIQVRE